MMMHNRIPENSAVYEEFWKEHDQKLIEAHIHTWYQYKKNTYDAQKKELYTAMYKRMLKEVRSKKTPTAATAHLIRSNNAFRYAVSN